MTDALMLHINFVFTTLESCAMINAAHVTSAWIRVGIRLTVQRIHADKTNTHARTAGTLGLGI